jgi:hypothetical protein
MKAIHSAALAVFAGLTASVLMVRGDKSTSAETGAPGVKELTGNYMTQTTDQVKKRDLVITRIFDAPIELVWKAWTDAQPVDLAQNRDGHPIGQRHLSFVAHFD